MGATHQTQRKLLDALFGNVAVAPPTTWYFALYTVPPTNSGGGTEASYGSYARVPVTNNTAQFPAAAGGDPATKTHANAITFPAHTGGAQQTVVAVGWLSAATAGTLWGWTMLAIPKVITTGDAAPSFAAGQLDLLVTGV